MWKEAVTVIGGFILIFMLVIGFLIRIVYQMEFLGRQAQIEQLRKDVQVVSVAESEDVIGQVTLWNQKIASSKAYNKTWWGDLFIPDGWDSIPPIVIPQRLK